MEATLAVKGEWVWYQLAHFMKTNHNDIKNLAS